MVVFRPAWPSHWLMVAKSTPDLSSATAVLWRLYRRRHRRHTKGMHLLQSGVSLEMIRDFLGHVDVKTTQIYARANLEMKRRALEKVAGESPSPALPSWQQSKSLLDWLRSL